MGDHMFKDLALSRDTMKEFRGKKYEGHPSETLNVMVLQQSVWPFAVRKTDVDLPPAVSISATSSDDAHAIAFHRCKAF